MYLKNILTPRDKSQKFLQITYIMRYLDISTLSQIYGDKRLSIFVKDNDNMHMQQGN